MFWVMESPSSFRAISIDFLKILMFTNFPKAFLPDKEFHSFNSFLIVVVLQFSCLNLPFASSSPIVVLFLIEIRTSALFLQMDSVHIPKKKCILSIHKKKGKVFSIPKKSVLPKKNMVFSIKNTKQMFSPSWLEFPVQK